MKSIYTLLEGGNVFKNADGSSATVRIDRDYVKPTVKWLEQITALPLLQNMLGTTGKKATSGDLDLGVDASKYNKDGLVNTLTRWVEANNGNPKEWIKKSGINVHFKTPIAGNPEYGFVQTDFMFVPDLAYSTYFLHSAPDSNFKGMHRNVLLSSIAKAVGYKINQTQGLIARDTNELVTNNWDEIAKVLLSPTARKEDLHSVETIMNALARDPNREAKIKDAREYFEREGLQLEQGVSESYFLAKLRDRLTTPGIYGLYEQNLMEARIEHPEDLPFTQGGRGIEQAISILSNMADTTEHVTIKWDGKPAVIFGRNPKGQFVLTDKSGFDAKGYDGRATSPEMLASIMSQRKGDRSELIAMYQKLFPLLERVVSPNFRGYVQGDLLFGTPEQPKPEKSKQNRYVFTPNTITYEVDADSDIGHAISKAEVAVAIHTHVDEDETSQAIKHVGNSLRHSPGVLILDPYFDEDPHVSMPKRDREALEALKKLIPLVNDFMRPEEFRNRKISDLPQQIKKYVNARVREGHYDNLAGGFIGWIETAAPSQQKAANIKQYIAEHKKGFAAIIKAFLVISQVKSDIVRQLDQQVGSVHAHIAGEPGHEGYVADTEPGPVKFVDRMRFSQANFAKNNPELG